MMGLKPGYVRERAAAMLALVVAAGIALTACTQAARPPATTGAPPAPASPPEADPPPQQAEKIWSIGEDAFDDDANLIATTNRSKPFAWDGITGAEGEKVTVSIGGHELPFTNKATAPRFENDLSGAEWEVSAEVSAGSIVLVLTAPDQTEALDYVESVRITNRGSGYTAPPAVTFGAAPASGATAAGTAAGPGQVASVRVTTAGSGYPSAPAVTFAAAPSGGTTAAAAAVAIGQVASVSITNGGTGYTPTATVAFGPPAGGTTAAGTVFGPDRVESVTITERGSGWTATPRIVFSAPQRPGGSKPSLVTVFLSGGEVDRVGFWWDDSTRGSGYTSAPTVSFHPNSGGDPDGGSSGVAVLRTKIDGVTITSGGSGYTSAPAVYFSPPRSGTTAIGTAVMNYDVEDVTITNPGSGYTSAPTVTFAAAPSGGSATTAVGTATLRTEVTSVAITNGGSGYTSAPTVTFAAAPSTGTTATGVAVLAESGNDQYQNLFWARDTLSGRQLRVRVGEG